MRWLIERLKKELKREKFPYYVWLATTTAAVGAASGGAFLLMEHLINYGFDLTDFPFGHEWYGLFLLLGGTFVFIKQLKRRLKV